MKLNDFQNAIVALYDAKVSVYLRSSPGRGKSTVIESAPELLQAAKGGNFGIVVINAGNMNVPDAGGYLIPVETPDGRAESRYTEPYWFVTREGKRIHEYDGGIILIDEMDKADVDVKKILGEAMLSGRLGTHFIPEAWRVWGAGNKSSDRSGSTKELDHLINRRLEIEVDDDLTAWDDWAGANGIHPVVRTFVNQNPQIVFQDGVPEKQGPWCTPRSIVNCGRMLMQFAGGPGAPLPTTPMAKELAAGMIGAGASAQLFATIQLEKEMPLYADILANPTSVKLPKDNPAAQMLICYQLAARVTETEAKAVITYVDRMPKEFAVLFAKAACKRDPSLVDTDDFGDWALENSSLMQAIINTRTKK
ncbi:ATP-binding protein [Methylobacterium sp. 285MFTsu5.1]|uniref:ATP-binding protein n=1 Tax=Methylobacterium sp. 285MFTsu5.1 TaxID=1172187 RepID=UPI000364B326|nr:ATP-binding protein [Methylobacterium sp. 285MFTsu5.1]